MSGQETQKTPVSGTQAPQEEEGVENTPKEGVVIEWVGVKLNSPHPERRVLRINTSPPLAPAEVLQLLKTVVSEWYKSCEENPWWRGHYGSACKYCNERRRTRGLNNANEYNAWKEWYCLRHGAVEFIYHYDTIKGGRLIYSPEVTVFEIASHKHSAKYTLLNDRAEVEFAFLEFPGTKILKTIKFTYRNYGNSIYGGSSYDALRCAIRESIVRLASVFSYEFDGNLVVNDIHVIAPSRREKDP